MKKAYYFLFLFSCYFTCSGQNPFPNNNDVQSWKVMTWYFWGGACIEHEITLGQRIELCEDHYTEVLYNHDDSTQNVMGYYKIVGDSVFVRKTLDCTVEEKLMYDFLSNIGDTLKTANYSGTNTDDYPYWKNSADTMIDYLGTYRNTMNLNFKMYPNNTTSFNDTVSTRWIEGIGSIIHPFYSLDCLGDFCETEHSLTQSTLNGNIIYENYNYTFSWPCTSINLVDIDKLYQDETLLYPNPTEKLINLNVEGEKKIYNSVGEIVIISFNNTIDVGELPIGIYLLKIKGLTKKFVKE